MDKISVDPKEYVVFDIETNGLKAKSDDILSISLYKPDDRKTFSRFLPLELSRVIKTTEINGITKNDLDGAVPLKQRDIDMLFEEFELERRTILIYAPLDGFDDIFLYHYMKRKHLRGFEKLRFYNIKNQMISSGFSHGNVTKDNLCKMFKISNVRNVHSGINDCRLEWELFKKMDGDYFFITDSCPYDKVFRFTEDYIIPVGYLNSHPNLRKMIKNLPSIDCDPKEVYSLSIDLSNTEIRKFPTNFNGAIIENLLNKMLSAKNLKEESKQFLFDNKCKLEYVGKIPSAVDAVPMKYNDDGTYTSINENHAGLAKEMNYFAVTLKQELMPLVSYIKEEIFANKHIFSQELVVNKEHNVLTLCDLSSENAVLEIKTNSINSEKYKYQLFFESKGRKCYHLSMDWMLDTRTYGCKGVVFNIFEVSMNVDYSIDERTLNKIKAVKKTVRDKMKDRLSSLGFELIYYISSSDPIKAKCCKCGCEIDTKYSTIYYGSLKCRNCH